MPDPIEAPPGFAAVEIFEDPTPNAILVNRISRRSILAVQRFCDLNEQEGTDFCDLVVLIARKMASVWKHLDAYHAEEKRLIAEFEAGRTHAEYSQHLFEEFDVFAVQIKSTLDHLVKVMRPMIGHKWTMRTFADKGETVLASLKRNTGRKHEGRVKSMEFLLFSDHHKAWLTAMIDTRDRVNHCQEGGLKISKFAVIRDPDGTLHLPTWSDEQTLAKAMDRVWENFFQFVEDFLAMAINFRVREEFQIFRQAEPIDSPKSSWYVMGKEEAAAFIKKYGATPV